MKNFKLAVGSLVLLVGLIWGSAAAVHADDKQAVSSVEHKLAAATTTDEALKYYGPGDDVEIFDMMGPPREFAGHKAIRDHFADILGQFKDVKIDFVELKVISDGKLALARSVQHLTAMGPDGKPFDTTFRQTDLLRKTHGQWKIIDQHISVPVDLKTGKADMASGM
ncbi:MAG TPA: nuclear transport factor 2 family protein [Candidatus Binataceae bacterium]|jgi:ketosteroid isomerase-like protein|nr:nuclear transport factor 2 family protein [Candidatus Binataceae bacterium]